MKILLVASLFPPDAGVSALRMSSFFDNLSLHHEVDVLKLGKDNDFSSKIMTIDDRYFSSLFRARSSREKISGLLIPVLKQYDLLLISTPPYSLCEVAVASKRAAIKYIFDLRDHSDLIFSEQKNEKWWPFLMIKAWLTERYIINTAKRAAALLCVGSISTALMQQKISGSSTKVINVHNGFNSLDKLHVLRTKPPFFMPNKSQLIIGCVGNLHNFRNTTDLRKILTMLNDRGGVVLHHWGRLGNQLSDFFGALKNLKYIQHQSVPRSQLLQELHGVDCFLLACSDDLIWEPTTSVFDYILFNKPIIYSGLRNNEAFCIMENMNMTVIDSDSICMLDSDKVFAKAGSAEAILDLYSREYAFMKLQQVVESLAL
jgi:hypothetical protein